MGKGCAIRPTILYICRDVLHDVVYGCIDVIYDIRVTPWEKGRLFDTPDGGMDVLYDIIFQMNECTVCCTVAGCTT